jgi:hypothetical protein
MKNQWKSLRYGPAVVLSCSFGKLFGNKIGMQLDASGKLIQFLSENVLLWRFCK